MDLNAILGYVLSAIGGGGLVKLLTLRSAKKKAVVEVKMDEIQAIHNTVELVYQPIIEQQNKRIQELESEVRELRTQLTNERKEHQKDIDLMNKRILMITNALGLKANDRLRDESGRYKKNDE